MRHYLILLLICLSPALAGAQSIWQSVPSGTGKDLLTISFGSNTTGYIGGKDSTLLKTVDGGQHWTPVQASGLTLNVASPDIIHLNFISADTGFAITSMYTYPEFKGTLHQTTNGGATWTVLQPGTIAAYTSFFFDASNGFLAGAAFFGGHVIAAQYNGVWS
ncbi:MAG: hypothetical protein EOP49_48465, partial [Sphingobacteriales bacterium]